MVGRVVSDGDALTVNEAADRAGVSAKTIRRAIDRGALRALRPGGCRRIVVLAEDLAAWRDEPVVPRSRPATPAKTSSRRSPERGSLADLRAMERSNS